MRRRNKTGGKAAKTQRRKTLSRRNAPKSARNRRSSAARQETEVARLTRELHESREQQAATSEVLGVISSSPGELGPVFEAILENATRICGGRLANLFLYSKHEHAFRLAAQRNAPAAYAERWAKNPVLRIGENPRNPLARLAKTKRVVAIPDLTVEPGYINREPRFVALVEAAGARTHVLIPMLKEGELIGGIAVYRQEVLPFTDRQIELLRNFADQAVIAIENTRLLNELRKKALEQQTATSEVLQVIQSSPGELEPVFQAMLGNATRLCEAKFGILYRCEGDTLRTVAIHGAPQSFVEERRRNPIIRPNPDTTLGRALATKQPVQISDVLEELSNFDARAAQLPKLAGARTVLAVPMLKDNELIGATIIFRREVRPFTDKQIELVKNFAAQAVIAIENARLLSELRQRTDDLTESLEQQTATSEILEVISNSPTDTQPAFDAIVRSGLMLFPDAVVAISLPDRDLVKLAAIGGADGAGLEALRGRYPMPLSHEFITGTAILDRREIDLADAHEPPKELTVGARNLLAGGYRAMTVMPMTRGDETIGALNVVRRHPGALSDKQRELLRTFANQAVIAIENTRLFSELRESLQQQTATADVLKIISSSPGNLEPVFEAILENATRMCEAKFGVLFTYRDGLFHNAATRNVPQALLEFYRQRGSFDPPSGSVLNRLLNTREVINDADNSAEQVPSPPTRLAGAKSFLAVPMFKDTALVGAIVIYRQEVRPFTDKQIELLTSFAAQAVIAIENARLLSELRQREQDLTEKSTTLAALSSKLAKYLAPQVYDSIFTGQQDVKIVSARKKLTVCFSDLVGFTEITDQMESEDLTQLLNQYLTEMSKIALQYGATIDKYVGDAIVMFFGDPTTLGVKQDALACVQMAIAMQQRVGELAQEWRGIGIGTPLRCRIGIHTGYCTVGNFGSEDRMDYTMVGGTVNLASRLEHEAPPGGILISFETCAHVKDEVHCEERGQVQVKGIAYPVATYAVLGPKQDPERDVTAHLRLDIDPDRMTDDERRAAADKLRRALGLLEKGAKPNG